MVLGVFLITICNPFFKKRKGVFILGVGVLFSSRLYGTWWINLLGVTRVGL